MATNYTTFTPLMGEQAGIDQLNGAFADTPGVGHGHKQTSNGAMANTGNGAPIELENINQALAGGANSGTLWQIVSWMAKKIKDITGKTNWYDTGGASGPIVIDIASKAASATPSTYPDGSSSFTVSGDATWPNSYGRVITDKYGSSRCLQWFYYAAGPYSVYFRFKTDSADTWQAWEQVVTSRTGNATTATSAESCSGNAATATSATNVSTNINEHAISDILESDGITAKKATKVAKKTKTVTNRTSPWTDALPSGTIICDISCDDTTRCDWTEYTQYTAHYFIATFTDTKDLTCTYIETI